MYYELTVDKKLYEANKSKAQKEYSEKYSGETEEESANKILFHGESEDFENIESIEYEGGDIIVTTTLPDIGEIFVRVPVDLEMAQEIIEHYIKKLNKVRTVLEAVK